MKTLKKLMLVLLSVVMITAGAMPASAACASSSKNAAGGYYIPASMTIRVGERQKLVVKQPAGKYANVSFQYSPNYVSSSGYSAGAYWGKPAEITYTGKRAGSFISYVTLDVHSRPGVPSSSYAKYTLQCYVNVVDKQSSRNPISTIKKIALQKISLNRSSISLNAGMKASLAVSYFPFNTTDSKLVTWRSSNASVVSVVNGRITAKKAGTATITARVGSKTAVCRVTVKAASSGKANTTKSNTSSDSKTSSGSYKNVSDAYSILNTFRTTSGNQWYWNPNNTTKTTTYGLRALTRDTALENTAKTRAKEQWTMYYEKGRATHDRPNGTLWYTAYPSGLSSKGENLAWGQRTSREAILDPNYGWAETNCKYSGQGHRRNMLSSNFTKVGIACYEKNGKTCWAMCLGR